MSTANRYSNIRQTRSTVRAVEDAANPNLATEEASLEETRHSRSSFEPSIIDLEGGENVECGGCDKPNNAELYMVQCRDCSRWWHLSCAHVKQSTVHREVFLCSLCAPRIANKQPSSVTSRITTSSVRQANIARELERLEEERKLMERMHMEEQVQQEKARKEKLERERQYLAKKFDLLKQQDEVESSRNSQSRRSQHSSKDLENRVQDWMNDVITVAEKSDVVEQSSEILPKGTEQDPAVSPFIPVDVHATSTPKPDSSAKTPTDIPRPPSVPLGLDKSFGIGSIPRTTESMTLGETVDDESDDNVAAVGGQQKKQNLKSLSFVDVEPLIDLLRVPFGSSPRPGTLPKLLRNQPTYEQWRFRTHELERKHQEENELRRKRELELVNQLNGLQMQRNEDLQKQRELKQELQRREVEQGRLVEQRKRELADLAELQQREKYQNWINEQSQRKLVLLEEKLHQREREQRLLNEQRQRELTVRDQELARLAALEEEYKRYVEARSPGLGSGDAGQGLMPDGIHPGNVSILDWNSQAFQSTPIGGRTPSCAETEFTGFRGYTPPPIPNPSQNTLYPPFPLVSGPPTTNNCPPSVQIAPTHQQLAARQVISRELPIFAGDPVDWPLFYGSYSHSTQACGYSDSENLMRLQKSLKGSAKEAVSSFLLHPSTVNQVMATLKLLYGRPEQIVQSLINKVRSTPAPKNDRLDTLVSFGLVVQNLCGHLKAIGLDNHLSNPILLQELVEKLPITVKFNWALYQQQQSAVDLGTFGDYMANVVSATSGVISLSGTAPKTTADRPKGTERAYVNTHSNPESISSQKGADRMEPATEEKEQSTSIWQPSSGAENRLASKPCPTCKNKGHKTEDCGLFKRLSMDDRWKVVKENKLCGRCLTAHARWPCEGQVCGINQCPKRHHRLLHYDNFPVPKKEEMGTNATVTMHRQPTSFNLFRVVPVTLYGSKGRMDTYAFLDDGSSVSLIEDKIADALGLDGAAESLCIHWTGGIKKNYSNSRVVSLEISAVDRDCRYNVSEVYTVDNLGLPEQTMKFGELAKRFEHLKNLPVRDLEAAVPGILIGLNNVHLLASFKLKEGREHEPIATKTRLGWTVYGNQRGTEVNLPHRQMYICSQKSDQNLHDYVRQFFALESLGVAVVPEVKGSEEQRAYTILNETTVRLPSGRFKTGLLWKYDNFEFPDSKLMAIKRLECLERRLRKSPQLYENVRKQISEYEEKGYSHKATAEELERFEPRRTWYLPLGVVLNPKKPEKIRLIWDAAAMVDGVSLNSMLMKGSDLLTPLLQVMFPFREREVAFTADVREMFHQLFIREEDRSALLYLWRKFPNMPMEVMVMDVAIFGASCSPTQAQYVKNVNALEYEQQYPRATNAILRRHYVDDYLDSVDTVEEAVELATQVMEVHGNAGFHIRNWISNKEEVLKGIGEADPAVVKHLNLDPEGSGERLLGMMWQPKEDVFSFALNFRDDLQDILAGNAIPTKRQLLRIVMSIFDPLGLLATFVVHGKIMIQELWRTKVGWDELIPNTLITRWEQWLDLLRGMNSVKIPRCYFPGHLPRSYESLQLRVFVDASDQAFAAVAYFRIVDRGTVRCALVSSKTKVAPLQPISTPRAELLAAVLGARLRKTVEECHSLKVHRTYFWSDSTTVRAWITSDLRRYRQYVALRVNEILSLSRPEEWRWIDTHNNVADEATKWGKGPSFNAESRWYRAPKFLYESEQHWPGDREGYTETEEELRPAYICAHFTRALVVQLERFSKWERLHRCVAYTHRFINNVQARRQKKPITTGTLIQEELLQAERTLWRTAQSEKYSDEIALLRQNNEAGEQPKRLEKSSSLAKLSPITDEFGVIRMDSRLAAAEFMTFDTRFPIIIPRESYITQLLVDWFHRRYRHANDETVINEIRQNFHISKLRGRLGFIKRNCIWCRVYKTVPVTPRMASLPLQRLTPFIRPFTYVGIDYFGPYNVKFNRGSAKRWVALFTCLTIRAIHLEIAATLSTDSCKKAIRRFVARRGAPLEIFTDNGTNFVGASRELAEEIRKINREVSSTFTDAHTQWRFNPPSAPHMGGCWERMVRSVKVALRSIPTVRKLDEESLATLLAEAEHMINSRPLTFVSLNAETEEALTPNHFLLMNSKGVKQLIKDPVGTGAALRGSWNMLQHVLDHLWKRWLLEYLPTITRRTKWFEDVGAIVVGDLVMIADEKMRNKWIRGRVLQTYAGKDGVARRADVQIAGGII